MEVLAEIVAKYVVTADVVNRDDNWTVEFHPVRSNDMTLRTMLTADTRENGALARRLPKVPNRMA